MAEAPTSAKVLEMAVKVKEAAEGWLRVYRMRFIDLDELQRTIEFAIRREVGLDCYYYVDECPTTESREFYDPGGVRLDVERAVDSIRCEVGGREVDIVIGMERGVVEFIDGKQFWLIVDFTVEPNEELGGGE